MSDSTTSWPELAIRLYDKLAGRGARITYEFEQLEVFVPSEHSETAPLARWRVNGALTISTTDSSTAEG